MTDNAKYPDTARGHVRAFLDTFERDSANDLTFSGVIAANMTPDDPVLTINALHGLLADGIRVERELTEAHATLNAAYRERAHLVALLAAVYPSHIGRTDPAAPDWPVVTLQLPTGQAAWHISAADKDLFEHVEHDPEHAFEYDGHSTEEKYARIRDLTTEIAAVQEATDLDVMAVPAAEVRRAEQAEQPQDDGDVRAVAMRAFLDLHAERFAHDVITSLAVGDGRTVELTRSGLNRLLDENKRLRELATRTTDGLVLAPKDQCAALLAYDRTVIRCERIGDHWPALHNAQFGDGARVEWRDPEPSIEADAALDARDAKAGEQR